MKQKTLATIAVRLLQLVGCSLLLAAGLTGCGNGSGSQLTGTNNIGGVAATGAPLALAPVKITRLSDGQVTTSATGADAFFQATLDPTQAPYLVEVTDNGVTPAVTYSAMVLASDIGGQTVNVNVTPLSTIAAQVMINTGIGGKTDSDLTTLREQAMTTIVQALQPYVAVSGVAGYTVDDFIHKIFVPQQDPFDKFLDLFKVSCNSGTQQCQIIPSSQKSVAKLGSSTLTINVNGLTGEQNSAAVVQQTITNLDLSSDAQGSSPVVVVLSAPSRWGTASDSWAGYSGTLTIYNFSDKAISGGSQLYFVSQLLNAQGFWNGTAVDVNGTYTITLPSWANLKPFQSGSPPQTFTLGFSGQGVPESVTDLSSCNLGGDKCLMLLDNGTLNLGASAAATMRSWAGFEVTGVDLNKTVPPPTPDPTQNNITPPASNGSGTTSPVLVGMTQTSSWDSGFNGMLSLSNPSSSGTTWSSWSITFTLPSGFTQFNSWGNYQLATSGASVTVTNETWNGTVAPGGNLQLGFGGVGTFGVPTQCMFSFNGGGATACTITNNGGASNGGGGATPAPTPTPAPNPPAPTPSPTPTPTSSSDEPTTVAQSVQAVQTGRVFVGYYPSWSDNWFSSLSWNGQPLSDDAILVASKLARVPGTYTHIITAFAQPDFTYSTASNFTANAWTGTGLNFNAGPQDIKRAIDVLHARGIKVLVAVGGATYNNWAALAAEGSNGGPITSALAAMLSDVGFDGLDIDYEVEGADTPHITEYTGAINAMRRAVDTAGNGRVLTLAGWSTGADCTTVTGTAACNQQSSYWSGSAGRERQVFSDPTLAAKINMVSVMSYDARYEHYDGVSAWTLYRGLFPSSTIVNIGLETAPEGWAGGLLVVNNSDASAGCAGTMILQDQFSNTVNQPYSVERYASAVKNSTLPNKNVRDGAMLWHVLKTATSATCSGGGSAVPLASPGTIDSKISTLYGLPQDSRSGWQ